MKSERQLQLVNFEQAQRLKALGFNWEVNAYYVAAAATPFDEPLFATGMGLDDWGRNNFNVDKSICSAPTIALALKWIREAKFITSFIEAKNDDVFYWHFYWYVDISDRGLEKMDCLGNANSYEDAEFALLNRIMAYLEHLEKIGGGLGV